MNRLWLRLALGFALVSLVSTLSVAVLANIAAEASFRGYLARSLAAESGVAERLTAFYAATGSWAGADGLLTSGRGMMGRGQGTMMGGGLILADAEGQILADAVTQRVGFRLGFRERVSAIPLVVEGQVVGYLLVYTPQGAALSAAAREFLDSLNLALWTAGLLASSLGLVLGLVIARSLAAPLDRLADGARQIAQGQRAQPVQVRGPREIETVATAFNEMVDALATGEAQRRHMVADIAHELRTPLTVIQGNLRALLDGVYPLTKAEVATIYDASLGLRRLVEDLRELSLAEAGQIELHMQPVAVIPLLAREASLFAEQAQAHQIQLTLDTPAAMPALQGDPERLAQIIRNLVSNALRHTPPGGTITLRASYDPPPATPTGLIRLEVADTGMGIAAEDLPHIFERFYRADRGRTRATGGSGLGLAITAQLVQLHRGTIGAMSKPGQGTQIWMVFPATQPIEPPQDEAGKSIGM
ncbi:MAG: sensor histidine kinase [Oscillochloridaceae bacterium umkhey_bin13]